MNGDLFSLSFSWIRHFVSMNFWKLNFFSRKSLSISCDCSNLLLSLLGATICGCCVTEAIVVSVRCCAFINLDPIGVGELFDLRMRIAEVEIVIIFRIPSCMTQSLACCETGVNCVLVDVWNSAQKYFWQLTHIQLTQIYSFAFVVA